MTCYEPIRVRTRSRTRMSRYITRGKWYEVTAILSPYHFMIEADNGEDITCRWNRCPHIGLGTWRREGDDEGK